MVKSTPQIPVVLASLFLWFSFAWALPAEAATAEGEAEVGDEDPWAGVRISDAYDYAKCTRCGQKNEIRAERCSRCGCELPQPSAEMADPDVVFVPGRGYYREGTLLEPGKSRKGFWMPGVVISVFGLLLTAAALGIEEEPYDTNYAKALWVIAGAGITFVGGVFVVVGFTTGPKPVYAFADGERLDAYERPAFTLRSPDSDGGAIKVEVTALGF